MAFLLLAKVTIMETKHLAVVLLSSYALGCGGSSDRPPPAPTDSGTDRASADETGDTAGANSASWDSASDRIGPDSWAPDVVGEGPVSEAGGAVGLDLRETIDRMEAGAVSEAGGAVDLLELGETINRIEAGAVSEAGGAVDVVIVDADVEVGNPDLFPISIDTAADGVAGIPCNQLNAAWTAFVANNRACSTVADCRVIGGAGTCNCAAVLGNGSGDAISASAQGTNDYFARLVVCEQQGYNVGKICDAAPAKNLRCENGLCTADEASCLMGRG